jgi:hypothetical protein
MNTSVSPIESVSGAAGSSSKVGRVELEILSTEKNDVGDATQFRAALDRHMKPEAGSLPEVGGKDKSLGQQIAARATSLATEINKDQQHVSKMLEEATRTGDSMQLMKALMALNDYQIRVQTISKTVAKATSSIEQLTKLQ